MDQETFRKLKPGDIIRHVLGSDAFVVTDNFGSRVTIVRTMEITNPMEWVLIEHPITISITRSAVEYVVHETGLEPGIAEELLQSALDLCLIKAP